MAGLPGGIQQTRAACGKPERPPYHEYRSVIASGLDRTPLHGERCGPQGGVLRNPRCRSESTLESLIREMDRFSCVACRGDFVTWQLAPMIFISL
jgi:hypothetical protein